MQNIVIPGVAAAWLVLSTVAAAGCGDDGNDGRDGGDGDGGGDSTPSLHCEAPPVGAVGATYSFVPVVLHGSGNFTTWTARNLPDGLTMDPGSGTISGIPLAAMTAGDVAISVYDVDQDLLIEAACGEFVINASLDASPVMLEPKHCIDMSASQDDILALLQGGDGTEITCSALTPDTDTPSCPLGHGNGRLPPGVSFDESSCSYTGAMTGDRRGTWVWIVEVTQSGYSTRVPFCATNDADTFHDITLMVDGNPLSDLIPAALAYDPSAVIEVGGGSHRWSIDSPSCPGSDCNSWGYRWNRTCSPFDAGQVTLAPATQTATGITHEMSASGPAPGSPFAGRPFVLSLEMAYCTAADGNTCDPSDPATFETNAQTHYHFDVVAFPNPSLRFGTPKS